MIAVARGGTTITKTRTTAATIASMLTTGRQRPGHDPVETIDDWQHGIGQQAPDGERQQRRPRPGGEQGDRRDDGDPEHGTTDGRRRHRREAVTKVRPGGSRARPGRGPIGDRDALTISPQRSHASRASCRSGAIVPRRRNHALGASHRAIIRAGSMSPWLDEPDRSRGALGSVGPVVDGDPRRFRR